MFRLFGHDRVSVLDGGLSDWIKTGFELERGQVETISPSPTGFTARLDPSMTMTMEQMRENCESNAVTVLDARPQGRFMGIDAEPRPGLKSGHMPGAISLPFSMLLKNGRMKSSKELLAIFNGLGVSQESNITTSCGSGVTAAIITLALSVAGLGPGRLYDGSWTEWASYPSNPIMTGG